MSLPETIADSPAPAAPSHEETAEVSSTQVGRLLEDIRGASRVIQQLISELSSRPDPHGARERTLRAELDRRDGLTRELGTVIARADAGGAIVSITAPTPASRPAPALVAPAEGGAAPRPTTTPTEDPPASAVRTGGSLAPGRSALASGGESAGTGAPGVLRATPPATVPFSGAHSSTPMVAPPRTGRPAAGPLALTPTAAPVRSREISVREPSLRPTPSGQSIVRPPPAVQFRTPDGATPRRAPARADLGEVLTAIGKPAQMGDEVSANAAVRRLMDATSDLDAWLGFPTPAQRSLVGLASSIARHLQDEAGHLLDEDSTRALRSWFPVMSHWSKLYRPGFVPGLSRRFGPERDSWLEDAEYWWTALTPGDPSDLFQRSIRTATPFSWMSRTDGEPTPSEVLAAVEAALQDPEADPVKPLEQLLEIGLSHRDPRLLRIVLSHTERVQSLPGLKTLKSAIREASSPDEEVEGDDLRSALVPDDWPYFSKTEGKDAVMIGGDPRQESAERIRGAFRFATVDWEESDPRRVDALVNRVRAGSVGLVILLRGYLAHRNSEVLVSTCKESGVPYVLVDTGYGVSQVQRAIERYLRAQTP